MPAELLANILLVDDRPENLLALESILGDLGQNLVRAGSGREALRHLLTTDFALILLDVQMPDLDGFELAELIRARKLTERTPIIFVSAVSNDEKYIFKGYSLGAVDYLTKPFKPEILRSKTQFFIELYQQNQQIKRQSELLEQANAKLDRLNSELENRVQERTAQLQTANRELEAEIIERKKVETERENLLLREKAAREHAETANRLKDEFLATVSHELRTPLNPILGWCQMMQDGKLGETERERAFETIYRNAKAQSQLINDLLDTSRLITGNLGLHLVETSIVSVIDGALDVVRQAAEAKRIELVTEYEPSVTTIICDAGRLQQIVWNLLTNAVKFTPSEGRVTIRVVENEDKIQIVVSDTGLGIEPEFLPFVFDRFRQADSSITRKYGGLGLGLAIVRHLTELHGGTATVHSEGKGTGTTFTIALPKSSHPVEIVENNAPEPEDDHRNGHANPKLAGLRVVLVDDDADTREMLTFVLDEWGAQTLAFASAAAAFAALETHQPDILLTDIGMPDEDGYALISRVREQLFQGKAIPAIALTAHAYPEDIERSLSNGFQLHLAKPIDVQKLAESIVSLTRENGSNA